MARKKSKTNTNFIIILAGALTVLLTVWIANNYPNLAFPSAKRNQDVQLTGSGSPNGPHYNLNLIGVPKQKSADMKGDQGHRIFVNLEGKTKINLYEGDDYLVMDANGTDGKAAFQLPNPDPDNDGITEYSVWARPLGKPGGSSKTTTCALDETGQEWCSVYSMVLVREKGKSSFSDVSKQLLYIYVDLDADGTLERYPLFDDSLEGYFWDYDNNGLKLVQLRFYEVVSDVN